MALFNIRVELHHANSADYQTLLAAMNKRSMFDVIQSNDGVKYKLPSGEYCFDGVATIEQVRENASQAAQLTGKSFGVRVTCGDSAWRGLQTVPPLSRTLSMLGGF